MYINISSWFYQILSIYFQWPLMPVSKSSYYPVWEQFYFFPDRTLIKTKERCLSHIYIYVYLCYFLSLSLCLSPSLSLLASLIYVEVLIGLTPPPFFTGSLMFISWSIKWKSFFLPEWWIHLINASRSSVREKVSDKSLHIKFFNPVEHSSVDPFAIKSTFISDLILT